MSKVTKLLRAGSPPLPRSLCGLPLIGTFLVSLHRDKFYKRMHDYLTATGRWRKDQHSVWTTTVQIPFVTAMVDMFGLRAVMLAAHAPGSPPFNPALTHLTFHQRTQHTVII